MLSHIEMAPAAGFKLFGTVITQPMHGGADATAPGGVKPEQEHEAVQGGIGARGNDCPQRRISPPLPQQEAAEARAAAEKSPLPCPRCRSRDTKFCYFNNYNVNQPRHFCRACHRYWTAGGALRNVPVGAGRRKNRPVGPAPSAVVGHRAATGASGFVLGFPNQSCPAAPLPVYTGSAELDRWRFFPTERTVESDRGC